MNETLALTKYAWTRYRIFFLMLIPVLLLSATLTPVLPISQAPMWLTRATASVGYLAVLISLFGSIALFGFSRQSSLVEPTSGYDTWLLRQPISNWKLAIIPAGLITVWISTIWTIILRVVQVLEGPDISFLAQTLVPQSLGMSAFAITTCALVWMPFGAAWQRIVLLIFSVPLIYFVGVGVMVVFFSSPEWMPWAVVGIVVCYIASIVFAFYSVKLARVASFQQSKFAPATVASKPASAAVSRSFAGWPDALNWHDSKRSQASKLRAVFGMLPIIAILFWIFPVSAASAIFALVFVAAIACVVVASRFESPVWGARSSLPSYLIASPIPSRTIASVRLRKFATEYVITMLFATLLWLSCFAWQSNRAAVSSWWSSVAEASASSMVPLRMVAAIYLAILVVMLGASLRSVCVLLRGRHSITLWLIAACCLALISPLIGFLGWFLQQRDWEHVSRVADDWLRWSYQLFYIAMLAKLLFDAGVVWLASKSMFSWREIITVIVGWCVLVVAAAVAWYALWPLGHVQFVTVLMAASLAIPLSVSFAGPLAVQANRHYRVAR